MADVIREAFSGRTQLESTFRAEVDSLKLMGIAEMDSIAC